MALYSVHLQGDGIEAAAEAAFVRQAFNWKAFFLGPLWLAWHRLWAALALWAAAYLLLLGAALSVLSASAAFIIALAFQALLGLEASGLREAKLATRGYHLAEIIAASRREGAEIAFYRQFQTPDATLVDTGPTAQGGAAP
jgi:Protein of unknown function (DUF2628)